MLPETSREGELSRCEFAGDLPLGRELYRGGDEFRNVELMLIEVYLEGERAPKSRTKCTVHPP